MNHQGLYWPGGRSLFRRRLPLVARIALYLGIAGALTVVTMVSLHVL